jgi:adenosylcobyric acid synthase
MIAKVVMVQGSSSSAGKSLLVTALCRLFARRGIRVAPFKAQNMSNNAAVCADGSEIGRSQAVQAAAAGIGPCAEMNPVLLKPESNARSQVIVMGRPWRTVSAGEYYRHKGELWAPICAALDCLRAAYEVIVIEGAGSPAELNLRAGDLVNMAIARYARAPVLLVGDIDRGGIFAQLLGTLWLLEPEERALVRALVVNKFRGDMALFADGVRILEARSELPVLGVIPFIPDLAIPEEDSATLDTATPPSPGEKALIDIVVIRLPRIANFDDFAPLAAETGIRLRYVNSRDALGEPQAIIIPGTKSTMADLMWLRDQGLDQAIQALAAKGRAVIGICGGYQMLGRTLQDPERVESTLTHMHGLGLLPVDTVFIPNKATHQVEARILDGPGWLARLAGETIRGYEIHMGHTLSPQPWLRITRRSGGPVSLADGTTAAAGSVWGCYLHGLFENTTLRRAWLASLGWYGAASTSQGPIGLQAALEALADHVEASLNMAQLERMIWGN